jgi:hypothetical protein
MSTTKVKTLPSKLTLAGRETLSVVGPLPREFDSEAIMEEFRTALSLPNKLKEAVPQVC